MGRRRRSNAILMWRGVAGEEEEDEESGGEDLRPLSDDDAHRHSLEEQEDAIVYQGDEMIEDSEGELPGEDIDELTGDGHENAVEQDYESELHTADKAYDTDKAMRDVYEAPEFPEEALYEDSDKYPDFPDDFPDYEPDDEPPHTGDNEQAEYLGPGRLEKKLSTQQLAYGLYCQQAGTSRSEYERLREVWQMGGDPDNPTMPLPKKLDTLKEHVKRQTPRLKMWRKRTSATTEKLASLPAQEKAKAQREGNIRRAWQYWYDSEDLVTRMLSAGVMRDKMHFGMAHYADESKEIYQSNAWGSSAMTTSGHFAHARSGDIILPGDIIKLMTKVDGFTRARVTFVGEDHRSSANIKGQVILTLQPVVSQEALRGMVLDIEFLHDKELVLLNQTFEAPESEIYERLAVTMDWTYDPDDECDDYEEKMQYRHIIRQQVDTEESKVVSIRFTNPTRADIELSHYGRPHLEAFEHTGDTPSLSLPLMLYIDDFGIYRTTHQAIKAFYLTPAAMSYKERRRLSNMFTLTLGPDGASFDDMMDNISEGMLSMHRGFYADINGTETYIRAFTICVAGDMPQAADSMGYLRFNVTKGCRACYCDQEDRGNLYYNTEENGRFHFDEEQIREEGYALRTKAQREEHFKRHGMKPGRPPIYKVAPTLNIIQGAGYDICHSEWRGIGRKLFQLFLDHMLTGAGAKAYVRALQICPFPPGWQRIQSPRNHMKSWSMSETAKAMIITPLVMRCYGSEDWLQEDFLAALESLRQRHDGLRRCNGAYQAMVMLLTWIAEGISKTGIHSTMLQVQQGDELIVRTRECFQFLVDCAEMAATGVEPPGDENSVSMNAPGVGQGDDAGIGSLDHDTTDEDEDSDHSMDSDSAYGSNSGHDNQSNHDNEDDPGPPGDTGEGEPAGRRKKRSRTYWQRLRCNPTIHVGLHIIDNIFEYGHLVNPMVLPMELYHSVHKARVQAAFPPNLMGYLFENDNALQSIRLGFAGAWQYTHPELAEPLLSVRRQCPLIAERFLPSIEDPDHVAEEDEAYTSVEEDALHSCVKVNTPGFVMNHADNSLHIHALMKLSKLQYDHPFITKLHRAFDREYGIRGIVQFDWRDTLHWFRRVSFTTGARRYTYNIEDSYQVHDMLYTIQQFLVVVLNGRRFLFLIATHMDGVIDPATGEQMEDTALGLGVYTDTKLVILGLASLVPERVYLVKVPERGTYGPKEVEDDDDNVWGVFWLGEERRGRGLLYVECPWRLDYM